MWVYFINLTNGLEVLESYGLDFSSVCFVRIQSTYLEQGHFEKVIANLDDNFLFHLAIGDKCIILDASSRYSDGISRVCWQGVPLIKYVLNRCWYGLKPEKVVVRGHNCVRFFDGVYRNLSEPTKKKLKYYRTFVNKDKTSIQLVGESLKSKHDGDKEYFADVAKKYFITTNFR